MWRLFHTFTGNPRNCGVGQAVEKRRRLEDIMPECVRNFVSKLFLSQNVSKDDEDSYTEIGGVQFFFEILYRY